MIMKRKNLTNTILVKTIEDLYTYGYKDSNKFMINLAKKLDKPTRQRAEVNLSKLERVCEKNETVVIPGTVLSAGILTKPLTVSAFKFSANAKDKIEKAGGSAMTINELVKKNPKGTKVRMIV